MEIFKMILHTHGGYPYIDNGANYAMDGRQVLTKGFGINQYDPAIAAMQFKKTAEFFNNEDKTPLFHYMTSFTSETAPTAEKTMELTEKIFDELTQNHLALISIHNEVRADSDYHSHTFMSPTNYKNGSMLYGDNATTFALAQRMANITGQPTKLIVRKENGNEWEHNKVFYPKNCDENVE